jgi:uncharacterized protein YfaP (DUF2135 family)
MLGKRERLWLPLCLIAALAATLVAFAQGTGARALQSGTPVTGTLDASNIAQVYSIAGVADDTLALTATNEIGVPLAIVITDAAGEQVAQAVDDDVDGELVLESVVLPEDGTYYITVFKAGGVASVNRVDFTLVVDGLPAEGTDEPETTPEPTIDPASLLEPENTAAPESTEGAETTLDVGQVVTTSGIQVTLTWTTTDDFDLEVRDPVGGSLYWETPTVASGGSISPNVNQGCATPTADNPTETASWSPGGVPTGSYEVLVYFQQACGDATSASFTVSPVVDGTTLTPVEATLQEGDVFILSFDVNADGTAALNPASGIVDIGALPATASEITASATSVEVGTTVNGTITNEQPYQAYTFQAAANDLVTISMDAQSGSLDTFLVLLDVNGNTIRFNDDLGQGFTDAVLSNVLLPAAGTYTVIATRYGIEIGGTEGDYVLTISAQATNLSEEFANLPTGSLEVRLLWFGNTAADMQLLVRDPSGDAVYDDVPQIRSGGQLLAAGNVGCTVSEGTPFSYIYWPANTAPRPGSYEVEVWFQSDCGNTVDPVNFQLYVTLNGQEIFTAAATPQLGERYLTSFNIAPDGTTTTGLGGIIRGVEDLDYTSDLENAVEIEAGAPVNGSITPDNKFDLYTFDATAGDVVTVAMNNTSGTLDASLYLIGPSGSLVAQNDDAVAGENTNSLIANLTLPENGRYIIIATHFGGLYGGTTGTYQLTYSQQS